MAEPIRFAPGWPGITPRWTSSAKTGVGTALDRRSPLWFTLSHGIFNEIYYPRIDTACTRDMGMIITDGKDFFSEEKRDTNSKVTWIKKGVPAFHLVNTHRDKRYEIEKEIVSDPQRTAVLQQTRLTALQGNLADYHLYVLLSPHLANHGYGNTAWVEDFEGAPMLFAQRNDYALALACSTPWLKCSVGFVGRSDGWQDLSAHRQMTWNYSRAENGNVALTAEIDLAQSNGTFLLALGFGDNPMDAARNAKASIQDGFDKAKKSYTSGWNAWQKTLTPLKKTRASKRDLSTNSAAVIRVHESKTIAGGTIASLSIPWGFSKGDNDLGGYHLVWPRDLVEVAGGFLALGAKADVQRVLHFLQQTQKADGHWAQNMWIDGSAYWSGMQLDETAFPILLVNMALRYNVLDQNETRHFWPMMRNAAKFIVLNGPITLQDRWEEDPGYSPFTLAVTISALLAAADFADTNGEPDLAGYLRETADYWNDSIERWIYVTDTDWSKQFGVEGYYVRIASPEQSDAASPAQGFVTIKNRPVNQTNEPAVHIISPDALALVRFGLRSANDPRIVNTIKIIDALLKMDGPNGPSWHRYNDDGYGEHEDGSPFDGTGVGRAWPLLTGERAHYELAAGRTEEVIRLLRAMESFASGEGLLSEQVWDTKDIPGRELFLGKPSGSAMPLVWAHAEYIKLRRSLQDGRIFDLPTQTEERYLRQKVVPPFAGWRFSHKCSTISAGKKLRVELLAPGVIHWSSNHWQTVQDTQTRDTGTGLYIADLPTAKLSPDDSIVFTFFWPEDKRWEGTDFVVKIAG
jgi:glucoamylase